MLFVTLIFSLEHSLFIAAFVFMVITWFAFIGMVVFGHVERNKRDDWKALNDKVNFETISTSYLTLYRLAHRDNWGSVYEDYIVGLLRSKRPCISILIL
eukprot:UN34276